MATATALALVLCTSAARADEPRDPYESFPLAVHHDKHYVRAGLEAGAILAVGLVDYMLSTTARGGTERPGETRWGLRYDWPTLRGKLIGTGLNLDTNQMGTNYVSHPLAGTLYYTAARSNHLSFIESYAFAVLGSTTWEYFGEIRETTSVNDLIVTPVSGAAIGEPLMQLSGFFRRGRKNLGNELAAFLLAPVAMINEWTDGVEPLRDPHPDALGLPTLPWHRFAISAGAGATVQEGMSPTYPRATYVDERFSVDMRLANLPSYGGAAKHSHLFDDGNVSRVRFDMAFSEGQMVDGLFATSLVPVGFYQRDAELTPAGEVRGYGLMLGLRMGFEYGGHDYDRDRARPSDIVALASPIGLAAEHVWTSGRFEIRTAVDVSGAISSITPYGLSAYRSSRALDDVLTTVRQRGYYHAFAFSAAPSIEVGLRPFRWTTSLRLDTFRGIEGLDEHQEVVENGPVFADRRTSYCSTIEARLPGTPWRLALDVRRNLREGQVGAVTDRRSETSAWASVGVGF